MAPAADADRRPTHPHPRVAYDLHCVLSQGSHPLGHVTGEVVQGLFGDFVDGMPATLVLGEEAGEAQSSGEAVADAEVWPVVPGVVQPRHHHAGTLQQLGLGQSRLAVPPSARPVVVVPLGRFVSDQQLTAETLRLGQVRHGLVPADGDAADRPGWVADLDGIHGLVRITQGELDIMWAIRAAVVRVSVVRAPVDMSSSSSRSLWVTKGSEGRLDFVEDCRVVDRGRHAIGLPVGDFLHRTPQDLP